MGAMVTLGIETSNPSAEGSPGVALGISEQGQRTRPLGVEPLREVGRHDDDLMPAIARLVERCGLGGRRAEIGRIAVSVGPGGYTAVRIACAVAKMMAEALGARCVAVPTALVVAARVPQEMPRPICVLLASKGLTSFATVIENSSGSGEVWGPLHGGRGRLLDAGALASTGARTLVGDRFVPDEMRREADRLGMRMTSPIFDPVAVLELADFLAAQDPLGLVPLYPREPDAVTLWRERGQSRA